MFLRDVQYIKEVQTRKAYIYFIIFHLDLAVIRPRKGIQPSRWANKVKIDLFLFYFIYFLC